MHTQASVQTCKSAELEVKSAQKNYDQFIEELAKSTTIPETTTKAEVIAKLQDSQEKAFEICETSN